MLRNADKKKQLIQNSKKNIYTFRTRFSLVKSFVALKILQYTYRKQWKWGKQQFFSHFTAGYTKKMRFFSVTVFEENIRVTSK